MFTIPMATDVVARDHRRNLRRQAEEQQAAVAAR